MPSTHRRRRRDETVLSRRRCVHEFATISTTTADGFSDVNSIPFFGDRGNCLQLLDTDTHFVAINLLVCLLNLQTKQTPCSLTKYVIFL